MIKRTIEISREAMHLAVRLDQLILQPFDRPKSEATSIPCEDIGVVLIDHPQVTYSHQALARLAEFGAALVVCGRDHHPAAILLPLSEHSEVVWRLSDQLHVPRPTTKRLWQQIVVAKVRAQARHVAEDEAAYRALMALSREVKSNDTGNIEAQAAKVYWAALRGRGSAFADFRRRPDGRDPINAMLNYGYTALRAAVARALVGAGLFPALGIHHCNRANAFCLADDLVEPLRPLVDAEVWRLIAADRRELDQPNKAALLGVLTSSVETAGQQGPLMVGLHRMAASLARCFAGEERDLAIPLVLDNPSC